MASESINTESKLQRLLKENERLKQQLDLPRVSVSEAGQSLTQYCKSTKDYLVPSVWGTRNSDPWSGQQRSGCTCQVM